MSQPPDSPLLELVDGDQRRARFTVHPPPREELLPVDGLLAGASEVDITPPPGLPKAGYSANARTGTGFRTRLRARVLHLRAGTASVALVQCDLLGGSAVVQRLVARAVAERTDVPLAGLFVGATHTHAGPGQYLGTDFYNRFASNRPGFDPAFTQFLVDRIAGGVEQAVAERRPSRLAVGSTEVWGLTRNRSLGPHVRNPSVADKRTEPQRKFVAVNPWLHLVRVDGAAANGAFEPLAAVVVFSVHGTGISMRSGEYNADLWAYVVGELAYRVERSHGTRPVVGAVEGTHADMAPSIRPGLAGYLEAARIGRGIGAEAAALFERLDGQLSDRVELGGGLREVDLEQMSSIDDVELPRQAAVGAALVAGAYENTTPLLHLLPPFRAGTPKRFGRPGAQGAKWVLGSRWLQPLVLPGRGFPRVLPVQVLRLGTTLLVGLPFELTVETGRRIEAAVRAALPAAAVDRVVLSSVANEYAGYATTPEEYELQHYEGGHTLYGPATQPFLAAHTARLAAEVVGPGMVQDVVGDRRFDLGVRRYLPRPEVDPPARAFIGAATFTDGTKASDGFWEVRWRDAAPGNLRWHEPLVRVEARDDGGAWATATTRDGRPVDDDGWDLDVRHVGEDGHGHRYAVRWWDPAFRAGRRHRFVLLANGGRPELASDPFD